MINIHQPSSVSIEISASHTGLQLPIVDLALDFGVYLDPSSLAFGVASCVYRLMECWSSQTFRKDDWLPIVVSILAEMQAVVIWLVYQERDVDIDIPNQQIPYWIMTGLGLALIWSSRISLALTLRRACTSQDKIARFCVALVSCFFVLFISSIVGFATIGCAHVPRTSPNSTVRTTAYCNGDNGIIMAGYVALTSFSNVALVTVTLVIYRNLRQQYPPWLSKSSVSIRCILAHDYWNGRPCGRLLCSPNEQIGLSHNYRHDEPPSAAMLPIITEPCQPSASPDESSQPQGRGSNNIHNITLPVSSGFGFEDKRETSDDRCSITSSTKAQEGAV
ncbi:hypothetical protein BKA70DRAFT_1430085 [Coprinopsis sp. MPI-PUGE-AT-0042]|nr:hypothetical protein BKA70DRAFT_1430085 [Coprinopsis sp. MPI-PUGE-AT-0042]